MAVETETRAWMERVLKEHRDLKRMLARLRDYLEVPRPPLGETGFHTWASGLSEHLVKLHNELFRHFRFEEQGGMINDLERQHPRATRAVHYVLDEHPRMLRNARILVADTLKYSEGREIEDQGLRHRVTRLLDLLAEHERAENDLILSLELDDIGAAD